MLVRTNARARAGDKKGNEIKKQNLCVEKQLFVVNYEKGLLTVLLKFFCPISISANE